MKSTIRFTVFALVLAMFVLAACGAPAMPAPSIEMPAAPPPGSQDLYQSSAMQESSAAPVQKSDGAGAAVSGSTVANTSNTLPENITVQTGAVPLTGAQEPRMIIKNAEVKLLVENTDTALDRSMQVVGDLGGYIISSKVWYQEANGQNYKFATMSIGVPVDQFESAMRRLRGLAIRVLDENASGQDVTSEYVDLQSQLGNLEATRDRIRTFLEDAKSIEESLRINQELTNIEGQIEQVKGRMNFVSNRSAYSTITASFEPDIPVPTPAPTMTPIPTATPKPWNPGETVQRATGTVTNIYQGLVEVAIWFCLVIIPLFAPPILVIWGLYKLITRKTKKA